MNEHVLNGAWKIMSMALGAVPRRIVSRPLPGQPDRWISAIKKIGNNIAFIDFKAAAGTGGPKWVWFLKTHKLWFKIF